MGWKPKLTLPSFVRRDRGAGDAARTAQNTPQRRPPVQDNPLTSRNSPGGDGRADVPGRTANLPAQQPGVLRRLVGATQNAVAGQTPGADLREAVRAGDHARLRRLMQGGADPNAPSRGGRTALDIANQLNDAQALAILQRANPQAVQAQGVISPDSVSQASPLDVERPSVRSRPEGLTAQGTSDAKRREAEIAGRSSVESIRDDLPTLLLTRASQEAVADGKADGLPTYAESRRRGPSLLNESEASFAGVGSLTAEELPTYAESIGSWDASSGISDTKDRSSLEEPDGRTSQPPGGGANLLRPSAPQAHELSALETWQAPPDYEASVASNESSPVVGDVKRRESFEDLGSGVSQPPGHVRLPQPSAPDALVLATFEAFAASSTHSGSHETLEPAGERSSSALGDLPEPSAPPLDQLAPHPAPSRLRQWIGAAESIVRGRADGSDLRSAVRDGDHERMQQLLDNGADPMALSRGGRSALDIANRRQDALAMDLLRRALADGTEVQADAGRDRGNAAPRLSVDLGAPFSLESVLGDGAPLVQEGRQAGYLVQPSAPPLEEMPLPDLPPGAAKPQG